MPRFLREATPDAGVPDAAVPDAGVPDAGPGPTDAGETLPGGVEEVDAAPTGPDACATTEEEERKARFRSRTFSALDFRPSAGYGKFDAYYWPRLSLMAAIVKMKFNYIQADTTPPLATLLAMWAAGQDISRFFWTDAQKQQFADDYVRRVADRWSFAHTFRSTKPCWPFIASPYVAPRVVDDVANAHFNVTVHKSAGPAIDYSSGFRAENPGTAGWRGTGDLYSSDVQEAPSFNSVQVARSERQRLERAVATATASPVLFAQNSAVIQPPFGARLRTLAEAMKARNPSDPAIPIVFRGFASAEGGLALNERLSEERAEAVADELRRAGVPQPLVISARGPVGAPNESANRKVEIAPSTTFETTYAANRYSVAEHEFGHTLGLPDEYVNRTTGALGAKQTAFTNLARAAGVAPPDRWGDQTASQMSAGVDVLPRHYLTVWEALGQMTSPDITRNDWSID
jgi:outer membrane protein OmpA-like peptidoglycan-associated protein